MKIVCRSIWLSIASINIALVIGEPADAQQGYVAHFEGEQLVNGATSSGGRIWSQPMGRFGGNWSGGRQLSWVPPRPGGSLHLIVHVLHAGPYNIAGYFTRANNCGNFRTSVNGAPLGTVVNGYELIGNLISSTRTDSSE